MTAGETKCGVSATLNITDYNYKFSSSIDCSHIWFYKSWMIKLLHKFQRKTIKVLRHPAGALTSLFSTQIHTSPNSHHISDPRRKQYSEHLSRRTASADWDKRPLLSVCLVLGEKGGKEGHCTLWISLVHSHPIVCILLCDWPNAVRTCITLKIDGKSWRGYIKGAALDQVHNWERILQLTGLDCLKWGTKTQRKLQ